MNARVLFVAALMFAAFAVARAEDAEDSALAGIETVEPSFVESDAAAVAVAESETETESESQAVAEAGVDAEAEGFPFKLSKHMRRTTIEPQYYGEPKHKHPRKFVSPEYRDPRARHHRHKHRGLRHNNKDTRPRVFTSHYFAPLPKRVHGKELALRHDREARRLRHLVPFRATVQTPAGLLMQKKGFQAPEIHPERRLPNKYDDPRQNMKKTKAPAPLVSLAEVDAEAEAEVEVDTTAEMEAESQAVPPPQFDAAAVGSATQTHAAVVVEDPANFFGDSFTAPTWNEEEATAEEAAAADEGAEDAETVAVEVAAHSDMSDEEALGHATELEAFLAHAEAGQASFVELNEESESDEEAEDEEEADEESEDEEEADEEADEESDEEADEESEEEADEEADEEEIAVALVEVADSEEVEEDEMAQNEEAAKQINMDAVSDEASMTEAAADSDEDSSDAEVDETMEAEIDEDHAVEEVADSEAADEAAALVQADEEVETLLAEVDAHVASDSDSDAEGEVEAEVEGESSKGTPGASIAAGQTWEDAQMARVDAMEAAMAAEKSSTPKVHATMVSSKAELNVADADMQTPEYNTPEAPRAEMVEPEMLVEKSAQTVLLEKIAKLKAIRRN